MKIYQDNRLKSYLAGLFEGDGHIWMPNESLKKKHNPRFCITFRLNNKELALKLLDIIGYGFIKYKPKNNICVFTISPVKGLKNIINYINGELRTPKKHQFYKLIDWINKNHNENIKKLPIKKDNLNKDGWLSGFLDADGSFSVQHTIGKKSKISCKLRLQQRMYDPITEDNYLDILTIIAKFLGCNLKIRKQISTGNEYYTIAATNKVSLSIIINYFNNFPFIFFKIFKLFRLKKSCEINIK